MNNTALRNWNKLKRPQKAEARRLAIGEVDLDISNSNPYFINKPIKPVLNTMWLPGNGCECVKLALKSNKISLLKGRHIFVEQEDKIAKKIHNEMIRDKKWTNKPLLHTKPLHELDMPHPINYAFLDFFGALDERTTFWLKDHLSANLANGCDLAFTFVNGYRTNSFMAKCKSLFEGPYKKLSYELGKELKIDDLSVLLYHNIIMSIFSGFEFHVKQALKYSDKNPNGFGQQMWLLRYSDFQKSKTNRWFCVDLFSSCKEKIVMTKKSRSEAAKKANETRKKTAKKLAKKRSEAAKKANETRGKAGRTKAAKKAWVTRRKAQSK